MDVACSNTVVTRDEFGQFISHMHVAAEMTMEEVAREGVRISKALAPVGSSPDPRTKSIRDSFGSSASGNTAKWWNTARHALPQELGGAAHRQTGHVSFFWEEQGRDWEPGDNEINHPGNPAHPYLRPAFQAVMNKVMSIARKYYGS